jgi:DHA1 family multidrug resistance protein-like MFS transporter
MNAFLAIVIATFFARLSYQMARSPVLPRFAQDLGAAPELIGIIVAASTVTGIFVKIQAGALSDILGRKRMILLGGAFFALPPFLYPFIGDAYALIALRAVHGFATAIFSPVASAYVASLSASSRGARLGWFSSATDVGATAGPLLGGVLLFYTSSYNATYLTVGVLGVLALALMLRLPETDVIESKTTVPSKSRATQFWQGLREVLTSPPVIIASFMESAMNFGFGAFLGFLPIYARAANLNDAEIALVLGTQLATAMLTKPISGWASDRIGRKPVIIVGLVLCIISLPLIFRAESLGALLVLAPVLGLGVATVTPVTNALVADLVKERNLGAAMGMFGTIFDIGEAAGPIVAGFLVGRLAYGTSFDIIAGIIVIALIIFAISVRDPVAGERPAGEGVSKAPAQANPHDIGNNSSNGR